MKVAIFEYHCRRCIATFGSTQTAEQNGHQSLLAEILNLPSKQAQLGMLSTHCCDDGGQGVGDLAGYRVEGEEDDG